MPRHSPVQRQAFQTAPRQPSHTILDTFANEFPDRKYRIEIRVPEFTSVCPITGQPDFGVIVIQYIPARRCVELKSLKYYMQSYRHTGVFYEKVVNTILDDLVRVLAPQFMTVQGQFTPRGGIATSVTAEHRRRRTR